MSVIKVIRPVKLRCFFFTLECISSSNIHVHVGIPCRYSLLINHLSTVSDLTNQTMIPESGIMDGRHQNRSVCRAPTIFSNSGHAQLASLIYFLFHFAPLGSLFTGWQLIFVDITFLFTCHATNLNCERSSVNFFKTSSICFASSLVGVIIMAPTWWSWKRERLDTKKIHNPSLFFRQEHCPALPALQAPSPKFIYWWWV